MTVAGVKTIFKRRDKGERTFVICFATIFILSKGIDSGAGGIRFPSVVRQAARQAALQASNNPLRPAML